jgi:hypothetical protein
MDYHALNRYFEPPAAPQERWAWPGSMLLAGLLAAAVIWAAKAPSPPVQVAFSAEIWSPTAQQAAPAPPPPPPPPAPAAASELKPTAAMEPAEDVDREDVERENVEFEDATAEELVNRTPWRTFTSDPPRLAVQP